MNVINLQKSYTIYKKDKLKITYFPKYKVTINYTTNIT